MKNRTNIRSVRYAKGSMLVVIAAVMICIIALLALLFNLVRFISGSQNQIGAAQAAALAVAQDLSCIVVNTPQYGYISFSDAAPNGNNTAATDQYDMPVRSINSLIGTARVDYIIAQMGGDASMLSLAQTDLKNAEGSASLLVETLQKAIQPGGSGQDIYGHTITPYQDAVNAFTNNLRTTGSSTNCTYVNGSMIVALGCTKDGVPTSIPVPQPAAQSPVNASQQQNGYYLSDMSIPVGRVSFAFAAIGPKCRLINNSEFVANPPMTNSIPAIVQVQADQKVIDPQNPNGGVVHSIACAQPADNYDPRPAPGALSISFPDGQPPEIGSFTDANKYLNQTATLETPVHGDFPTDPGSLMTQMQGFIGGQNPQLSQVWNVAIYDWIKRAGPRAQVTTLKTLQGMVLNAPLTYKDWKTQLVVGGPIIDMTQLANGPQIPVGVMYVYRFNADGSIMATNGDNHSHALPGP